jgi:putative lipoprotein
MKNSPRLADMLLNEASQPARLAHQGGGRTMDKTYTVTGDIVLPEGDLPDKAAGITVQIEDISRADAPSLVVGEQRMAGVRLRGGTALPFRVTVPAKAIEQHNLYSVRVHVDITGAGEVRKGDYVTTQTHPVLTQGHGSSVRVPVTRV